MTTKDPKMSRRTVVAGPLSLTLVTGCAASAPITAEDRSLKQAPSAEAPPAGRFANAYLDRNDTGARVPPTYFLRRARVQLTRDLAKTEVPPTEPLNVDLMASRSFAVSWFGHSSMLLRAGAQWLLLDPVFSDTAGPLPGVGPARLTPLPISPERLPRIDVVLISHDHYDHLDLGTVRRLARQPGGPPRFLVGKGLGAWFAQNVGAPALEFGWWQSVTIKDLILTFAPAQHNSGRGVFDRNATLWGGWVVEHASRRFYYAGDTAFIARLFEDIRARVGVIHLAALPIGAYLPREMMRFEHMDPHDASDTHRILGARSSFGVHWGTLQLGDEEPFEPARDLAKAVEQRKITSFGIVSIGSILDLYDEEAQRKTLTQPSRLRPTMAG